MAIKAGSHSHASACFSLGQDSPACKKPHLHADSLRDALFSGGALARHGSRSDDPAELLAWVLAENDQLAARPDAEWLAAAAVGRKGGVAGPAFEKVYHRFFKEEENGKPTST